MAESARKKMDACSHEIIIIGSGLCHASLSKCLIIFLKYNYNPNRNGLEQQMDMRPFNRIVALEKEARLAL